MLSEKKKKNDDDIATLSAVSKATSKKYLDDTGLGHLSSLIISFVRNYAATKTHNHDGVYAKSSHAHTTSQVTGLDSALAGKADKSHTHDDRYYTESEANSKFSPIGGSASLNKLSENVTLGNGSAGSIVQNSGTYHQKFEILDDANAGTDTFVFSQSTDSGAKFTKLMSIRDDGNVVANKFTGALSGNAVSASSVPWSGVAGKPSSFTPSSHTHDDRYYTESEVDSKLAGKAPSSHTHTIGNITNLQSSLDGKAAVSHGHSAATTSAAGFMSAADKSKLDGVATGANKTIVDSSLSSTSVNPVQNKVVNSALAGKASTSHTHTIAQVTDLQASLDSKQPKGSYASRSHTHTIANVTNLQSQLDGKQPKGSYAASIHTHDASNITSGTVSTDRLPVMPVSKGGTGKTTAVDSANMLINSLSEGASAPTDSDYYVCQYAGGGTSTTTYHRRPMSALWSWIKSKCDALYQAKGSYASSSHTHSWGQITGKPSIPSALTYMPVGYVYISWSSTSPASMFGGSWVAITGRFPYFNAGTGTGGSNSHTLSINELASHNHRYNNYNWIVYIGRAEDGGDNAPQQWVPSGQYCLMGGQGSLLAANISGVNAGNSAAHNNMPSYQNLYAWRRTA